MPKGGGSKLNITAHAEHLAHFLVTVLVCKWGWSLSKWGWSLSKWRGKSWDGVWTAWPERRHHMHP